jgi:outer membrane lipoprotein SlyB
MCVATLNGLNGFISGDWLDSAIKNRGVRLLTVLINLSKDNSMRSSLRPSSSPSGRLASVVAATALLVGMTACAPMNSTPVATYPTYPSGSVYSGGAVGAVEYGRVTNVEVIRTQEPGGSGTAGAIIGGIAGAVIGNQVGRGTGKDLATIAGGVGGAVAGNAIAKNANTQVKETHRVSVQVDGGAYRSYDMGAAVDLRAGDRVRIENGQLYRM